MRVLFLLFPWLVLPAFAQHAAPETVLPDFLRDVPRPLARAVHQLTRDIDRWAYTQHMLNFDRKGKVDDEVVARYDPSQHYDEQWTLISRNGKAAGEADIKKYRRERAKRSKNRQSLGELLELSAAQVMEETPGHVIYDVPLRKENNDRLPPEKFQIRITVSMPAERLERIDLELRSAMRVAVIAKVKNAGASLRFETVDPRHAPALVGIDAQGRFSVMFVPVNDTYKLTRSDFKRVKPYDERFGVTIGPLKVIDF